MQISTQVQFIPATGQPEYAVVPYSMYLELKERQELIVPATQPSIEGNPIKHWRRKRGLSQPVLAKMAQISVPYLSQLENNLRVGSKEVLKRLALSLSVTIDQIL